jgi:hypothetical protein
MLRSSDDEALDEQHRFFFIFELFCLTGGGSEDVALF